VVFDTNVVVSALVFGQRLGWLRRAWAVGAARPIVCRETVAELIRVLAYPKFRLSDADRTVLLADYLPYAETARLPDPPPTVPAPCRDRSDLVFIQLALAATADCLVSGDADLATLAGPLPIASPATLRRRLGWHDID
jgi:putative PIN family toxin of toxin-antitoxin system